MLLAARGLLAIALAIAANRIAQPKQALLAERLALRGLGLKNEGPS